jgi:outer membrane protein, multidrug efflux system
MLDALADAEAALVRAQMAMRTQDELDAAARAGAYAADKTQRLFDAGLVERPVVLDARQAALRATDALLQARVATWQAAVDVRRAFCTGIERPTTQKVPVTK